MRKVQTLITLLAGVAIGVGATKLIPKVLEYIARPEIDYLVDGSIVIRDNDSKSIKGYFESTRGVVAVESPIVKYLAKFPIPEGIREGESFSFYAEDPEGHKTETRKYLKEVIWR